jgi:membrane protein implicated in regulation of membrane protease activity
LPEFLSQLTAFSVFLGIAAFGFLFLLISLVFAGIFDHVGFDHDHDFAHDGDHGGPSFLSPRVLSVFITAFGGFGAISTHYGLSVLPASGVGFGSGVFFAGVIYYFARFLYGQQVSTQVQTKDLAGQTARVVVPIPPGGLGQVRCQVGEEIFDKVAKSRDGSAIVLNSLVTIEQVLGEVVIVKPN